MRRHVFDALTVEIDRASVLERLDVVGSGLADTHAWLHGGLDGRECNAL
jgi:hypothetical protein